MSGQGLFDAEGERPGSLLLALQGRGLRPQRTHTTSHSPAGLAWSYFIYSHPLIMQSNVTLPLNMHASLLRAYSLLRYYYQETPLAHKTGKLELILKSIFIPINLPVLYLSCTASGQGVSLDDFGFAQVTTPVQVDPTPPLPLQTPSRDPGPDPSPRPPPSLVRNLPGRGPAGP